MHSSRLLTSVGSMTRRVAPLVWWTACAVCVLPAAGQRVVVPLDGEWSIEEGAGMEAIPASFGHKVVVPGLVHSATPPFADVDVYFSREYLDTRAVRGILPAMEKTTELGHTPQKRTYFWYMREFRTPARKQKAILAIQKAQFGTAVWLNGRKIGEHLGSFTTGYFDLTGAIDWQGANRLLVRIGAHPGAVPEWVPTGTDQEKYLWTPGIYDSVSLRLSDDPVIKTVQVAPRLSASEIVVETRIKNHGQARVVNLVQTVKTWKDAKPAGKPVAQRLQLAAGEEKLIRQTVPVPGATLWSPENPFLYVVETSTGGDTASTRFGMREFHFDTVTRRAMLNGKPYFMRGASITLHRFFSDPKSKSHPWEEAWVRKLLVEIPKKMNWNSFRICIGPAPQMWLDIADEAGLLLQYEYAIWTGSYPWRHELWKTDELIEEFTEFMQDNWNHPSVVIWDASNETLSDVLRDKVIPAVRHLDLSGRPWENGYSLPQGPDDPFEDHPYLFIGHTSKPPWFQMTDLEQMTRPSRRHLNSAHAAIINEYEWLWLNREGNPTPLTKAVYEHLLGTKSTAEQRFALWGYLLGGITEYWRAYRQYAGVLYLGYLDGDVPNAFTGDNFRDPETLELEPYFKDYMHEAFKPLGVYLNFWQPKLQGGQKRKFKVMMVNDTYEKIGGTLVLTLEPATGGEPAARKETTFEIQGLGQMTYELELPIPQAGGEFLLKATANSGQPLSPTVSRRKVSIVAPGR